MTTRIDVTLTPEEWRALRQVPAYFGEAFSFWKKLAAAKGVDYKTIILNRGRVTALPLGHGKHWCYPSPLKCANPPPD